MCDFISIQGSIYFFVESIHEPNVHDFLPVQTDQGTGGRLEDNQEKAPRLEAAAPSRSKSSSSFMKELEKIQGDREEDPGGACSSGTAVQVDGFFLQGTQFMSQMTHTNTRKSNASGFLVLLPLPSNTSVHLGQASKVKGCSAQSPPFWPKAKQTHRKSRNACFPTQEPASDA